MGLKRNPGGLGFSFCCYFFKGFFFSFLKFGEMENPLGNYGQPKRPIQAPSLQFALQQFSSPLPWGNVKGVSPTAPFKFSLNLVPLQSFNCKLHNKTWAEIASSSENQDLCSSQGGKTILGNKWKRLCQVVMHVWVNLTSPVLSSKAQHTGFFFFFFLVLSFSEEVTTICELGHEVGFFQADTRMAKSRLQTSKTQKISKGEMQSLFTNLRPVACVAKNPISPGAEIIWIIASLESRVQHWYQGVSAFQAGSTMNYMISDEWSDALSLCSSNVKWA